MVPTLASTLVVASFACGASAQEHPEKPRLELGSFTLSPEVDVRLRGEVRRDPADFVVPVGALAVPEGAWAVLSRARLGLTVERGPLLAKITLQDARAMGEGAPALAFGGSVAPPAFGPYEAFVEARSSAAVPSFVRLGRQAVEWGEGRLLGVADFSPTGRSLDAVRARGVVGDLEIEGLAALLVAPSVTTATNGIAPRTDGRTGTQLFGIRAAYTVAPALKLELFGFARVADGAAPAGTRARDTFTLSRASGETFTASLRVSGRTNDVSYGIEGAAQSGSPNGETTTTVDGPVVPSATSVAAFSVSGHVDWHIPRGWLSPTVRVLGGYATGDSNRADGRHTQFDPLLPDTQRWHGAFDLFGFSNLADLGGQLALSPSSLVTATLGYRHARLAEARGDWVGSTLVTLGRANRDTSGSLGHELSAKLEVTPLPGLTFALSYAALVYGDGAKAVWEARRAEQMPGVVALSDAPSLAHYAFTEARLRFP